MDQVRALENGGDDYITKPFNLELAVAKVQSAIRRAYGEYAIAAETQVLWAGELWLDKSRNRVPTRAGGGARSQEFASLGLAQRHGQIVERDELWKPFGTMSISSTTTR